MFVLEVSLIGSEEAGPKHSGTLWPDYDPTLIIAHKADPGAFLMVSLFLPLII